MKKLFPILFFIILISTGLSSSLFAQTIVQGNRISFQGKLEQDGKPFTGKIRMEFVLWATGWSEIQEVQVVKGLYAVVLGSDKPIADSVFAKRRELELQIRVNGQTLEPRVKIYPVPFAYKAQTVEPFSIGSPHIQDRAIQTRHLADGIINSSALGTNSINGSHIQNSSIEPQDLKGANFSGLIGTDPNGNATWLGFQTITDNLFNNTQIPLTHNKLWIGDRNSVARATYLQGDVQINENGFVTVLRVTGNTTPSVVLPSTPTTSTPPTVANNSITTLHILDNTILPADMAGASADMVLVTNSAGQAYWEFKTAFASATSTAWSLTGNLGTNPLTNFIGTTDNADLNFRVNNIAAGKIGANTGNLFFGFNAGLNNTANNNIFLGQSAGQQNSTGASNTFVGLGSGSNNSTGASNAALGIGAGSINTTGSQNVFLGGNTGANYQIINNSVFLGHNAGGTNGNTATGTGNIFLGYGAGGNETGSNKLYIANSNTSSPLIYGDFANSFASVNGTLGIGFSTVTGDGLLAFQTGSFYGYSGGQWNKFATISNNFQTAILQRGNTFSTAVEIGTNDAQPLIFKVDNTFAGSISPTDGNMFLGYLAGQYTTGTWNYFSGYQAGAANTTGLANTFVGYNAGLSNVGGIRNTFVGSDAGKTTDAGSNNTFVGFQAGALNTGGVGNTFLGTLTGVNHGTGNFNTFLGNQAGLNNLAGAGNIFIGYQAGSSETGSNKLYIENTMHPTPLIYGDFANDFVSVNGNLALGFSTASYTPFDGTLAFYTGNFYGHSGGKWNKFATISNSFTTAIQQGGNSFATAVVIGSNDAQRLLFKANNGLAGRLDFTGMGTSDANAFYGHSTGLNNTSGSYNTIMGYQAGISNTEGNYNVFLGSTAGYFNATGNNNVFLGHLAGQSNNGSGNVFMGYSAGQTETGSNKLYIANSNTSSPLIYGDFANNFVSVNGNLALGFSTASYTPFDGTLAFYTGNFYGHSGGKWNKFATVSNFQTAILQGGNNFNTAVEIGTNDAQQLFFKANGQTAGRIDISSTSSNNGNTFYGYQAGRNFQVIDNSVIIGYQAGGGNGTTANGYGNVFIGYRAGTNETGSDKLYISNSNTSSPLIWGDFAASILRINGKLEVTNSINIPTTAATGVGMITQNGSRFLHSLGTNNLFLGQNAGNTTLTIGSAVDNVALGAGSGTNITTGTANTFVGTGAGKMNSSGSNNVYIGTNTAETAAGSGNVFIGNNVGQTGILTGVSNTLAIDNKSTNTPLIYGDFANKLVRINGANLELVTAVVALDTPNSYDTGEPSIFLSYGGNNARIWLDGNGKVYLTSTGGGTGVIEVTPSPFTSANTQASDRRLKENIVGLNSVLPRIKQLSGYRYNLIGQSATEIGVIAQEVEAQFPEITGKVTKDGKEYLGVKYDRLTAVLIEAVKELSAENEKLKAELKAEKQTSSERTAALEAKLEKLQGQISQILEQLSKTNSENGKK